MAVSLTIESYLSLLAVITSVATAVWVQINAGKNELFKHSAETRIQILITLSEISSSILRFTFMIRNLSENDKENSKAYFDLESEAQVQLVEIEDILKTVSRWPATFPKMSNKKLVGMLEELRNSTLSLAASAKKLEMRAAAVKPSNGLQVAPENSGS